jgi:hypothetical protein
MTAETFRTLATWLAGLVVVTALVTALASSAAIG